MDRGITGAMWTAFEQSTDRIVAAEESSLILILKKEIEKLRGRLKAYEDTGLTPEEVSALVKDWSDLRTIVGECGGLDRVRALAKADRDGRLVVLPCQSGEHVFALLDNQTHVWECEVEHAVLDGWRKVFASCENLQRFPYTMRSTGRSESKICCRPCQTQDPLMLCGYSLFHRPIM